jgi:hypothetical protein
MKYQIPVVVIETLSTKWIIRNSQEFLVETDNAKELNDVIKSALNLEKVEYGSQIKWQQVGKNFEELLLRRCT